MIPQAKAYFYKHWVIYKKSLAEKSNLLVYPLVGLFSVGVLALYIRKTGAPIEIVPFVVVGIIAWTFFELCQRMITYGVMQDIWDHCLKHSLVSPATIADYVVGNALFGIFAGLVSVAFLDIFSSVFFGAGIFSAGAVLALSLAIIAIFSISVGLGIDCLIIAYDKEYMALTWSISGIVMVFSGVYYPVSALPEFIQSISYLLPTTYAIDAIRIALGLSSGDLLPALLRGFMLSAAFFALFFSAFSRLLNKARKIGRTITE